MKALVLWRIGHWIARCCAVVLLESVIAVLRIWRMRMVDVYISPRYVGRLEGGKELELTQFAIELQLARRLERVEVEIIRRLSSSIGLVCPGGTRECVESNETTASAGQTKPVKPFFANRLQTLYLSSRCVSYQRLH